MAGWVVNRCLPAAVQCCRSSVAGDLELASFDYLVLFGGRNAMATAAPRYQALLKRASKAGVKLVGVDNGAFLLAACGLLRGHKVVVHWRHEAEFRAAFPHVQLLPEQLYCIDGNRITCAGGTAAIDLAVALLSRVCGRTRALKGLADMLVDETRNSRHALRSLEPGSGPGRQVQKAGTDAPSPGAPGGGATGGSVGHQPAPAGPAVSCQSWPECQAGGAKCLQQARWRLLNSPTAWRRLPMKSAWAMPVTWANACGRGLAVRALELRAATHQG